MFKLALLVHKSLLGMAPVYLQDILSYAHYGQRVRLVVPFANSRYGQRSFSVAGPRLYNRLPCNIRSVEDINLFKNNLKTHLFSMSEIDFDKLYRE